MPDADGSAEPAAADGAAGIALGELGEFGVPVGATVGTAAERASTSESTTRVAVNRARAVVRVKQQELVNVTTGDLVRGFYAWHPGSRPPPRIRQWSRYSPWISRYQERPARLAGVEDGRSAAAFRAVRIRRGWRQSDVADKAGVSRSLVSLIERGHLEGMTLTTLRRIGRVLELDVAVTVRWRGSELDRLLNADHAALHESVARFFQGWPDWEVAPEATYSIFGERGVIDVLAWHAPTASVLVIELKTLIVDIQDVIAQADRRRRLAARIAAERGWDARTVGAWLVVQNTRTNRRRISVHATVLRRAFPAGGAEIRRWLRGPDGWISALSLWTNDNRSSVSPSQRGRLRVRPRSRTCSTA